MNNISHPIRNQFQQMLATKEQYNKLVSNHEANVNGDKDHAPVIKLFTPMGAATWLLSELDPHTGIAFGLCDLGMGFPELGSVSLVELSELTFPNHVERDQHIELVNTGLGNYASQSHDSINLSPMVSSRSR